MKDSRILKKTTHDDDIPDLFITVRCCREWEVTPLYPWGKCGLCGRKPE